MRPARPDTSPAAVGAGPRRRGKSKTKSFKYYGEKAVIRVELDVSDAGMRGRVEKHYEAAFQLRRVLQRDARTRCRAYWADMAGRDRSPKQVRDRLGLSRKGIEALAKRHVEDSKWMRFHLSKASALHIADEVWETVDRHLFPDKVGNRHGPPRVGKWFDVSRIPGRARSHTKTTRTWETYRLAGSLQGHLDQYRPDRLDGLSVAEAPLLPAGTSVLTQPKPLPTPARPTGRAGWWDHDGPLTVVFTGLPKGDLVLPVRLPSGAGQWEHLAHYLNDPTVWHKIDLVRVQDRKAPGGWRYYAHLLIHGPGYQSQATRARRVAVPTGRVAGLDANVSNISIVSHQSGTDLRTDEVVITQDMLAAAQRDHVTARRRHKALDRSRRNTNPCQYGPSKRQTRRAARRAEAGLPARHVANPGGGRVARKDGKPKHAYRKDQLSHTYRRTRADHAADSRRVSQAKHARADAVAGQMVAEHGNNWIAEHVNITAWTRLWGKRIALFSPGMLQAALKAVAAACGGTYRLAGTRHTAMSQHCLCGSRVTKDLSVRVHVCDVCGLTAPRDHVSAALASAVTFTDPSDPATARVNPDLAQRLGVELEVPSKRGASKSTGHRPNHTHGNGQDRQPPSTVAAASQPRHTLTPTPAQRKRRRNSAKTEPHRFEWTHDPLRVNS